MKSNLLTGSIAASALLLFSNLSQAAQIQWTAQPFTDASQLIYVADNFITGYNFGSATDVTINNVTFTGNNAATLDDADFRFGNDTTKLNYSDPTVYADQPISGVSAAQAADLLESFSYDSPAGQGYVMTLKNLTVGQGYRIQALLVDDRSAGGIPNRRMHFSPDNGTWGPSYDYTSMGAALLMTGTFVADSTSQQFRNGIAGTGAPQLNAFSISTSNYVPEPATSMYIGLGMVALAFSRRLRFEKRMQRSKQN